MPNWLMASARHAVVVQSMSKRLFSPSWPSSPLIFDQLKRRHVEYISDRASLTPIIAFAGHIKGVALEMLFEEFAAGLNAVMVLDGISDSLGELDIDRFWSQLLHGKSWNRKETLLPKQAHVRRPEDGAPEDIRKPVAQQMRCDEEILARWSSFSFDCESPVFRRQSIDECEVRP
jgi:hypothetical protein